MLSFINEKYLFITSAVLSSISALFFLIGVCSYADNEDTVQNIPWSKGEESFGPFDREVYLGLQGGLSINNGGDPEWGLYSDCSSDTCDTCERTGVRAMVFCCLALILALATAGLSIKMVSMGKSKKIVISGIVCSLSTFLFSLMALVTFSTCANDAGEGANVDMYPGVTAQLVISGECMMFFAAIFVSCSCCIDGCNDEDDVTKKLRSNNDK